VRIDGLKKTFDLMGIDHDNESLFENAMDRIDLLAKLLQEEKRRIEELMRKVMRRK